MCDQGASEMKLLTEFVGTFLFLLCISLSAGNPIVIGGALMCMVYMGGHISGGHYNPAVSLAVMMRGKMDSKDLVPYMVTQVVAGLAAFFVGWWLAGATPGIMPAAEVPKALVVEILFTFMLALTVLNVATAKGTAGNSFYGLAIGFVIIVAASSAAGAMSGGAFNPAVGIAATAVKAMTDGGSWSNIWIYIVGPLAGGILAAVVFKAMNPEDV